MNVFDDVYAVKFDRNTVFLGFMGNLPKEPIWLLDGDDKTRFEPFSPASKSADRVDLQPRDNLRVTIGRGEVPVPSTACNIVINALNDWFVDGHDTFQIELPRQNAPFLLTFPEKLELNGHGAPLVFNARIAGHRLRAKLRLDIKDLVTKQVAVKEINFDPDFRGGKKAENYQAVSVPLPTKMQQVSLQLSINFLGSADSASNSEPFAFLYDAHITSRSDDEDDGPIFDESDVNQKWLSASAKSHRGALDVLFVQRGESLAVVPTREVENARAFFSEHHYEAKNPDVDLTLLDAYSHYLLRGWKEYRNPGPEFSVREYLLRNSDVEVAGYEPLLHYANVGKARGYSTGSFNRKLIEIWRDAGEEIPNLPEKMVLSRAQDLMVPMNLVDTRKLAVFVAPEHNSMSGGIYSIFSIADHVRRTSRLHGFDVLVMTRPNPDGLTYLRNSSFRNSETVLRLEQIRLFSEVTELQLHIPEYATVEFVRSLSPDTLRYLLRRDKVHVNILNQNTRLMPEPHQFRDLRQIGHTIGQSVSHHAFFGQEFADHYDLPSLLLPAYTDLTPYPPIDFAEKENLIIYSDDDAPYKREVLAELATLQDYKLVKIRDMTFDTYMDLATRCRFSVSFGEGFDGYVAQPMYQGGIGLALYTDEFFPDSSYKNFENFFDTEEEMISQIVPTIRRLEKDQERYEALNRALREKWDKLYSYDDYVARIGKLIRAEYEIFPNAKASEDQTLLMGLSRKVL